MKTFIRDNLMIVISVALPVLVVVLFALATVLPGLYVDPPMHNLVLAMDGPGVASTEIPVRLELRVSDGALRAQVYQLEDQTPALGRRLASRPRLFEYLAASDTVREIEIELPDNVTTLPDGSEIPIPELAGVRLVTTLRAPDGYELDLRRSGRGLFREIFGVGGGGQRPRIRKDGAVVGIDLPLTQPYYYGNARFIGWVAEGARE